MSLPRRLYATILALLIVWAGLAPSAARRADAVGSASGGLQLGSSAGAVTLRWEAPQLPGPSQPDPILITLRALDDSPIRPVVTRAQLRPWTGGRLRDDLPAAPVAVVREGRLRGARLVVLAVNPAVRLDDGAAAVAAVEALVPRAVLADDPPLPSASGMSALSQPAAAPAPPRSERVIKVAEPGVYTLSGAALSASGVDLAALDVSSLSLRRGERPVALEVRAGSDGRLDPSDELRFYAPAPGDRWNSAGAYVLGAGSPGGPRIPERSALPQGAELRSTAFEEGSWYAPARYDSLRPGPDGDHWFSADVRAEPGSTSSIVLALTPALRLVPGPATLTISGSALNAGPHRLDARMGSSTAGAAWSGGGDWRQAVTVGGADPQVELALTASGAPSGLLLDRVAWRFPAALDLGGRGAWLAGDSGVWRYQVSGAAPGRDIYDITSPDAPQRLVVPDGASFQFQDGPTARSYVVTGPGTLHVAQIAPPADIALPRGGDVVYIAPARFAAALAPLLAHRASQGHLPALVDVQAIYDGWSDGQVSPDAIRSFLRYAAAAWDPPPAAAVLVGDGSVDPFDYTRRGPNNASLIPPYMAPVDPWLGETACEQCYAQLDGDSPLDDLLPDIAIGRLPAKTEAELARLVAKILTYERAGADPVGDSTAAFIADDADEAGDFAALSDEIAALQPAGVSIRRLYYDPAGGSAAQPWRVADPSLAHARTAAELSAGSAIVTYTGHSHQWQWALTAPDASPPWLLDLYDPDSLPAAGRPPVVLAMTCLSSAFQTPAMSGTTIDERLVLAPGGAVAVWGPAGAGVSHGHDLLQRGFHRALRAAASPPPLGELAMAGYRELFAAGQCCQDALRTYAILGDPLTPVLLRPANALYLPAVRR